MASFERVDYRLRPNKNVERKLIVELLNGLTPTFELSSYRYIGMGSMWFVDFRLIHTRLGIRDMISIEREFVDRAEFNRPFNCVRVESGDSTLVLADLDLERGQSVVWLDHDTDLWGPSITDFELLGERLPPGSIVMVTVNAHPGQLTGRQDSNQEKIPPETVLADNFGDFLTQPLDKDAANFVGFPSTVVAILENAIDHAMNQAGRQPHEDFVRLFAFSYADGTPMVTIGGMIASAEERERLEQRNPWAADFATREGAPYVIDVPPLTTREKAAIDRLLPPDGEGLTVDSLREHYGFSLKESQIDSYQRFYRQYPLFGELML